MLVFHATVFTDGDALAGRLELFHARVFAFARFTAFGGSFVRGGHGSVAGNVFLGVFVQRRGEGLGGEKHVDQQGCCNFGHPDSPVWLDFIRATSIEPKTRWLNGN
jgi:hypothetical protein